LKLSKKVPNPWQTVKERVMDLLSQVSSLPRDSVEPTIEVPPDPALGDLATTVSFVMAKKLKKSPAAVASELLPKIQQVVEDDDLVASVEGKGPYINIFFERGAVTQLVLSSVQDMNEGYGRTDEFRGRRVLIESPAVNPSKPWHIGHARNAVLGDTLGNILEYAGYNVVRLDYINDLGLQIAQLVWKLEQNPPEPSDVKYDHYLGQLYVGVQDAFEKDDRTQKEIREVSRKLEDLASDEAKLSAKMVTRCLKAQCETAYRLGIYHHLQAWESTIAHSGLLEQARKMMLKTKNVYKLTKGEKAGCIVADLSAMDEFKDMKEPEKVLFRSDGTRTYTGADVAFHLWKFGIVKDPFLYSLFERQPNGEDVLRTSVEGKPSEMGSFDVVMNVIASRQAHPQRLVYSILDLMGYTEESENSHHIAYEFVGLEDESFSGRKGTWIGYSTDDVLDKAAELARGEVEKRNPDETDSFKSEVANQVAVGAIRYFMLNASPDRKITFRWEEALDFNGDAAPYLQYSYARARRILERANHSKNLRADLSLLKEDAEFELVKAISRFPQEVLDVVRGMNKNVWGTTFTANRITAFGYNLANLFAKFYDTCPVLRAEEDIKEARLFLVNTFTIAMRNCLGLLGIPVIERM
jgi:arginyl-tRNA synthetase